MVFSIIFGFFIGKTLQILWLPWKIQKDQASPFLDILLANFKPDPESESGPN